VVWRSSFSSTDEDSNIDDDSSIDENSTTESEDYVTTDQEEEEDRNDAHDDQGGNLNMGGPWTETDLDSGDAYVVLPPFRPYDWERDYTPEESQIVHDASIGGVIVYSAAEREE